jgi:hypothetical protein
MSRMLAQFPEWPVPRLKNKVPRAVIAKLVSLNPVSNPDPPGLQAALLSVVNLIEMWARKMEYEYGEGFWLQAEEMLKYDGRNSAWIRTVHQIVASTNWRDSVEGLQHLGSVGITWTLPGGKVKEERQQDCGFGAIYGLTRLIEDRLAFQKVNSSRTEKVTTIDHGRIVAVVTMRPRGQQLLITRRISPREVRRRNVGGQIKDLLEILCNRDYKARAEIGTGADNYLWNELLIRTKNRNPPVKTKSDRGSVKQEAQFTSKKLAIERGASTNLRKPTHTQI